MANLPVPNFDRVRFAYVFEAAINDVGLSYRQVAQRTGVPIAYFSRIRRAQNVPVGTVLVLCAFFGIDFAGMMPPDTHAAIAEWRALRAEISEGEAREARPGTSQEATKAEGRSGKHQCNQAVSKNGTRETSCASRAAPPASGKKRYRKERLGK